MWNPRVRRWPSCGYRRSAISATTCSVQSSHGLLEQVRGNKLKAPDPPTSSRFSQALSFLPTTSASTAAIAAAIAACHYTLAHRHHLGCLPAPAAGSQHLRHHRSHHHPLRPPSSSSSTDGQSQALQARRRSPPCSRRLRSWGSSWWQSGGSTCGGGASSNCLGPWRCAHKGCVRTDTNTALRHCCRSSSGVVQDFFDPNDKIQRSRPAFRYVEP